MFLKYSGGMPNKGVFNAMLKITKVLYSVAFVALLFIIGMLVFLMNQSDSYSVAQILIATLGVSTFASVFSAIIVSSHRNFVDENC